MSPALELLLVEDDVLLARALCRTLALRAFRARHVARCATAAALSGPYPIGIFDVELPDGDGIDLARLLVLRRVVDRVVFYTACAQQARLARARRLGPVFEKSGDPTPLLELLAWRPERAEAQSRSGALPRL